VLSAIRQKFCDIVFSWFVLLLSCGFYESSSPGEFHPQALTDPYVNLSIHTAPIV